MICLACLPFMKPVAKPAPQAAGLEVPEAIAP
jgi:hypothetical protein